MPGTRFAMQSIMRLYYDQGTLVLQNLPHGVTFNTIPLTWDSRIEAHRVQARHYSSLCSEIALMNLDCIFDCGVEPKTLDPGAWHLPELRPYQAASLELWKNAQSRGTVVFPTGGGKTLLALTAIAKTARPTLCLVPTRALLEQWHTEIKKYYDGPIGLQGDGSHTLEPITVATYESAYRNIAEFGNQFELIVIDECHHFGGGMRDEILEMSTASRRLGLTATLPSDEIIQARLTQLIGPVVFDISVGDLKGNYLANFDYFTVRLDLTPEERMRYENEITIYKTVFKDFINKLPGANYQDWIRYASRSEAGRAALRSHNHAKKIVAFSQAKARMLSSLLEKHWSNKTLIFTSDTESAYLISKEHLIMPITSDIGRREREEMLQCYRDGSIRALVSCRVLNEGLDVPDAEIAIIVGGTSGTREHIQRIGRILRPSPGKRAVIYEFILRNTIEVRQSEKRSQSFVPSNHHTSFNKPIHQWKTSHNSAIPYTE